MDPINKSRSEADAVLVVGSRLGETDWWGKPPYWGQPGEQKMVQVDIDDEILGLNKSTELAVLADANAFLTALAAGAQEDADQPTSVFKRIAPGLRSSWKVKPRFAASSMRRSRTRRPPCTARTSP